MALRLGRTTGQKIVIGGDIVIEILKIRGSHVEIGITAPEHIRIDREEIANKRVAKDEPEQRWEQELE